MNTCTPSNHGQQVVFELMLPQDLLERLELVNDNYLCRLATTSPAGSDGLDGPA